MSLVNQIIFKRYLKAFLQRRIKIFQLSSFDLNGKEAKKPLEPLSEEIKELQRKPWLRHIRNRAIVTIDEESETGTQGSAAALSTRTRSRRSKR